MSTLLVAAMTLISVVELNPSNWLSNSNMVRWTSLSPAFSESNLKDRNEIFIIKID